MTLNNGNDRGIGRRARRAEQRHDQHEPRLHPLSTVCRPPARTTLNNAGTFNMNHAAARPASTSTRRAAGTSLSSTISARRGPDEGRRSLALTYFNSLVLRQRRNRQREQRQLRFSGPGIDTDTGVYNVAAGKELASSTSHARSQARSPPRPESSTSRAGRKRSPGRTTPCTRISTRGTVNFNTDVTFGRSHALERHARRHRQPDPSGWKDVHLGRGQPRQLGRGSRHAHDRARRDDESEHRRGSPDSRRPHPAQHGTLNWNHGYFGLGRTAARPGRP